MSYILFVRLVSRDFLVLVLLKIVTFTTNFFSVFCDIEIYKNLYADLMPRKLAKLTYQLPDLSVDCFGSSMQVIILSKKTTF